jgi:hypothetical protein
VRLTAFTIALTLVACASGASRPLAPVRFSAGRGWHVGSNRVHDCPGVSRALCQQVTSWAATVRFRDCGDCVPPHRTLAALPASGISIQLLLGRETKRVRMPAFAWPPRIRARDVVGPIEGGPERVGSAQKFGRLEGFNAYLYVFFGRRHPSSGQISRANAELRSAKLP